MWLDLWLDSLWLSEPVVTVYVYIQKLLHILYNMHLVKSFKVINFTSVW